MNAYIIFVCYCLMFLLFRSKYYNNKKIRKYITSKGRNKIVLKILFLLKKTIILYNKTRNRFCLDFISGKETKFIIKLLNIPLNQ